MIDSFQVSHIADDIFDSLGISEDIYMTWDKAAALAYKQEYLDTPDYLWDNIAMVLAGYDTSDMTFEEVENVRQDIYDEVTSKLDAILTDYERQQSAITQSVISDLFLEAQNIGGVVDVSSEFTGPDYGFGIRDQEVTIKLANGAEIQMKISVDEDYI